MTGMAASFGGGMVNVCLTIYGEPVVTFSLGKGGDWIDTSVARALDMNVSAVQHNKETLDVDINKPKEPFAKASAIIIHFDQGKKSVN